MGSCVSIIDYLAHSKTMHPKPDENDTIDDDDLLRVSVKGSDHSLDGEQYTARVVQVYDGDTIRVRFKRGRKHEQHRVRMLGYDSAEITGKNRSDEQKRAAILAREALTAMVFNDRQLVKISCGKFDAFGRLLGTIYLLDGTDVNQYMVDNRYGIVYTGGKKIPFNATDFRCS